MTGSISSTQKMDRLSLAVNAIPPSGIRRFFDMAEKMENVISLGVDRKSVV